MLLPMCGRNTCAPARYRTEVGPSAHALPGASMLCSWNDEASVEIYGDRKKYVLNPAQKIFISNSI